MAERVLALDVSTRTGYAVLEGPDTLTGYGRVEVARGPGDYGLPYPLSYAVAATDYARAVCALIDEHRPDTVVIEETNPGHEVLSQRRLEWLHMAIALRVGVSVRVVYIRTGDWRRAVGLQLTRQQAKGNLARNLKKAKLSAAGTRGAIRALGMGKANAAAVAELKRGLGGIQASRVTRKHLAVGMANRLYGLGLKIADNDAADACLVGRAYYLGAPACDGKPPTGKKK